MVKQENKEYLNYIKNSLNIHQIYNFLLENGAQPQINNNIIISRTICHNILGHGSRKLYYYDNTKLFKCYTECNDTFDIFELFLKIKQTNKENIIYYLNGEEKSRPWNLTDSIKYIASYFGFEAPEQKFFKKQTELQDWDFLLKLEEKKQTKINKQTISLKVFEDSFLNNLIQPKIIPWEKEGITPEIMKIHNIRYDPKNQSIIIPHYDINNTLIGIRERTLVKENQIYGKYKPAIINGKMYNHPLSFNLYNINISKNNIKTIKKAIVFEGQKSCLKYGSFFGIENDISVASCGSNLINYQVELLLSLDVQEIIIGFDRQYKELGDEDCKKWIHKLTQIYNKYNSLVQISYLWDKDHLLDYKSSPIDHGKDIFIKLFNERIILN